jgi:excisionase family DNA binding protein
MEKNAMGSEELKNKKFVARYFGVSLGTVNRWVHEGRGPRFRKVGSLVRYSMEDLHAYLDTCPSGGENSARTWIHDPLQAVVRRSRDVREGSVEKRD